MFFGFIDTEQKHWTDLQILTCDKASLTNVSILSRCLVQIYKLANFLLGKRSYSKHCSGHKNIMEINNKSTKPRQKASKWIDYSCWKSRNQEHLKRQKKTNKNKIKALKRYFWWFSLSSSFNENKHIWHFCVTNKEYGVRTWECTETFSANWKKKNTFWKYI